MFTLFVGGPLSIEVGSGRPLSFEPPWLSFSCRCPCVSRPVASTPSVNGSFASGLWPWAKNVTMIPIDSYQDAWLVS